MKVYSKFELAESQLEVAVGLFVSGNDKFSAITLAGAADVIFSQLVKSNGKENFSEYSLANHASDKSNDMDYRKYGKHMNDTLFINALKHYDKGEDAQVTMDTEECTIGAILKAIVNFNILGGGDRDFVKAFLAWIHLNLDREKYDIDRSHNKQL